MKIAIIGYGEQGRAALEYWNKNDNQITVCDQNTDIKVPDGVGTVLGPNHLSNLDEFDLIVRSPVVHPSDIVKANSADIVKKITSVTNEFMRVSPTKNIIGVTGTKGKGTTSTLVTKMLQAAGKRVHLGGNIGTPPLDLLKDNIAAEDYVVLELANFQIIDLKYSPHIAVCLMVEPEHLDWHLNIEDYIQAKTHLFKKQLAEDTTVYFAHNDYSVKIANFSPGKKVPYYQKPGARVRDDGVIVMGDDETKVIHESEVKLLGEHNLQNVCAALTAVFEAIGSLDGAKEVLYSFSGLEHRLELVRSLQGVKYYDDSFGTTPSTAIVAMQAFADPKVMILGGSDKGIPFDEMADAVIKSNVRHAVIIGKTGPKITSLLKQRGFNHVTEGLTTMAEIVNGARQNAQQGDIVLLSTGCASFGLFENYKDRGNQFKEAVNNLE
ncbi:UDP-N-acetylmuramoyl-L-alanine--D-glutamate ligase [Candidatus Saccharibacteria bacterium]|nr:UDP-N-acetylmuramoyl-L-alanine--D-glutamate ligase [Candidatus Saccharibacteria bacterium]